MSLADRLAATKSTSQPGPPCGVSKALARLDQADGEALLSLIYERLDLSGAQVEDFLAEDDISISQYVINRHRLGRCSTCKRR